MNPLLKQRPVKSYVTLPCGCIVGYRECDVCKKLKKGVDEAFANYEKAKRDKAHPETSDHAWLKFKEATKKFNDHWLVKK